MKINWKVRLRNKTFWVTIIPSIVTIVYTVLGFYGVVPKVSQNDIINLSMIVLGLFSAFGCFVDPTTSGASDSEKALTYETPAPSSTTFLSLITTLLKRGVKNE